jgi:hypothetical protein
MDTLIKFILYYAKFVPREVLGKLFVQPGATQQPGYPELQNTMLSLPQQHVIPEIRNFVFSLNTKFLSDLIRDAKGFILFVEYGNIPGFTPVAQNGVRETVAITVAHEFNIANNDAINETLLMNRTYNILIKILETMYTDMKKPEDCPAGTLINFPARITPAETQLFFDRCGWSAVFERSTSIVFN